MEVLRANFSNYSAWHARTALLAAAHAPPAMPTLQQLLAGAGTGSATLCPPYCVLQIDWEIRRVTPSFTLFLNCPTPAALVFSHLLHHIGASLCKRSSHQTLVRLLA